MSQLFSFVTNIISIIITFPFNNTNVSTNDEATIHETLKFEYTQIGRHDLERFSNKTIVVYVSASGHNTEPHISCHMLGQRLYIWRLTTCNLK